ncbi:cytochrome P450 [Nocardia sp. NPDC004860]|uniref:cytochrome P450 n=1 Tax=Nocardia sp. NPDC004860 TaxID=3154557 RepID=UPI0033A41603
MTQQQFGRDMFNDFDIDDPKFNEHFTDVLDAFVAKCPVARSNVGEGYYVINRYEDVRRAGQDWQTFSSAKGFQPNRPEGLPYLYPEESDPPYHDQWRTVLNPFFAPRAVAAFEDQIRADATELIDGFIDRGECDFVADFGAELPGRAFFKNLVDVPVEDLPMLLKAMDTGIYGPPDKRADSFAKAFGYLGEHLAKRKDNPGPGDLLDAIAAGVDKNGELCPWEDRVSILTDLTLGGIATTTYVMSGAVHHLANNPADRKALAADPTLIPNAVEEFARVFPPVVALGRSVTRDVEVAGTHLKEGDFILLNYASASRDPEAVEDPSKLDIYRDGIVHTAFGVGVHRCIGSHLARLELRVVLEEVLRRIPDFEIAPGKSPSYETGVLRSMTTLPLIFPVGGSKGA